MITATLYADSNGTHLHQIYTGLDLLHRSGDIKLKLRLGTHLTQNRPNRQFIILRVEEGAQSYLAAFDMSDHQEIGLPSALDSCDFYFKRSLTNKTFDGLSERQSKKLKPFGFNYQVIQPSRTSLIKRLTLEYFSRPYNPFSKKNRFHIHNIKELIDANLARPNSPLLNVDEISPKKIKTEFDVLFQCRLWGPEELSARNRGDAEKVNRERIAIVRALRSELGDRFVGGLQPTQFAKKIAPDLVIESPAFSVRRNYISLVKKSSIVISSSGLLDSIGWKMGEYVALGKAIVAEPIAAKMPAPFEDGVHYQSYRSPEECIQAVTDLLSSPEKLSAMSNATTQYYEAVLSPRELMLRHLNEMLYRPSL